MKCRNCKSQLNHQFADLGSTPLANSLLSSIKQLKSDIDNHIDNEPD